MELKVARKSTQFDGEKFLKTANETGSVSNYEMIYKIMINL